MADPVVSYPFDPTGQASTNRITGELISVIPPGDRLFHYAMPKFAPFFEEGLVVKLRDLGNNVITLTKGVDYYLSHKFMDASLATMHPIWGSISFLRRDIAGTLIVDYNTLGGIWTIDSALITEILVNTIRNPRITSWEQVVERPVDFPVIDHMWNLDDMVGQKEILEVLQNFYTAYLVSLDPNAEGGGGIIAAHISNFDNPHKVTAAQVGAYSTLQMDTKLSEYLTKTGTAANSAKLENLSLEELFQRVVTTKVSNATTADTAASATNAAKAADTDRLGGKSLEELKTDLAQNLKVTSTEHADEAEHAKTADLAHNSERLGSKTLLEIMQDVGSASVANAAKFDNKTYSEVVSDIRNGKAADAAKLDGKTLNEIIQQLQQSTGDAVSLQGKTLEALMNDVRNTKVVAADEADLAADSNLLNGKSLNDILSSVANTVPNNAENANRVYGYTFEALINAILASDTWSNSQLGGTDLLQVEGRPITTSAGTGVGDPAYTYGTLGGFRIPLTGTNNDKYDPTAKRYSTTMELMAFFAGRTLRMSVIATIRDDQTMQLEYFCDQDLAGAFQLGVYRFPSAYTSADGTQTGMINEIRFKFRKADVLRRLGVFSIIKNDSELSDVDEPVYMDHNHMDLNTITWQDPSNSGSGGDQVEFDAVADAVNALLVTPAA